MPGTLNESLETLQGTLASSRLEQLPIEFGPDAILETNPHRFEMKLLSGIVLFRPEAGLIVGAMQLPDDEFWAQGAATLPRMMMIESAGQLCSFYWQKNHPSDRRVFALGEIKCAQFYKDVAPGCCLIVAAQAIDMNRRKAEFDTAGYVNGERVFDATIVGMALG